MDPTVGPSGKASPLPPALLPDAVAADQGGGNGAAYGGAYGGVTAASRGDGAAVACEDAYGAHSAAYVDDGASHGDASAVASAGWACCLSLDQRSGLPCCLFVEATMLHLSQILLVPVVAAEVDLHTAEPLLREGEHIQDTYGVDDNVDNDGEAARAADMDRETSHLDPVDHMDSQVGHTLVVHKADMPGNSDQHSS